jgi:hypothetical protein
MALRKSFKIEGDAQISINGLSLVEQYIKEMGLCYVKVETVGGNKLEQLVNVSIKNDAGVTKNFSCSFVPDMTGDNFIAQAYRHLKTLPDFVNAEDC